MDSIPTGFCQCGCGEKTRLATKDDLKTGARRGQPRRFIIGHHRRGMSRSAEERFWGRVERQGDNECWLWDHGRKPQEYGRFWDGERLIRPHVFSARLALGTPPPGFRTLHYCDNPPCVNPRHLFYGTQADNVRDMQGKGRLRLNLENLIHEPGERNPAAKLTDEQAIEMAVLSLQGEKDRVIARQFGIGRELVGKIRRGERRREALYEARRRLC